MARKKITAQLMDDLFVDAMGGDWQAEQEYRDYARKLAKRSNQQMLEQERRDVTGEAYRRAQDFLGGDTGADRGMRFKENVQNMDIDALRSMVDEMQAFQNAKDYSIVYATEAQQQIDELYEPLMKAEIDVDDAHVVWNMNELFKTDAWQEFRKALGGDTGLIKEAADAFAKGKTVDDVIDAYNAYADSKEGPDLYQAWYTFTGKW